MDAVRTGRTATTGDFSAAARRTVAFVAAGLGLLAVGGWLQLRPTLRYRDVAADSAIGKPLFPEFTDADKASSMKITSFDEGTATLSEFEVARKDGVWVLPSHQDYPADAKDQLAVAATALVDRKIVDVVSTSRGDHDLYGVREPDPEKVEVGETGVGRLVDFEIAEPSGKRHLKLVVGKEKPPTGPEGGGRSLRYVRKAGQDPVYLVELDTSKFSTKFEDWIERNLLKLSGWDIVRLAIDDSTASAALDQRQGSLKFARQRRALAEVAYDDKESAWKLSRLLGFSARNEPEERQLGPDEELATARLDELKNALADLTIVDVARKPAGMSVELKADEQFTLDEETLHSLGQRGFFPSAEQGGVVSSNGELVVGMKDGVEYRLRFGSEIERAADDGDGAAAGAAQDKPAPSKGRYLFVQARVNEDLLEKPKLQPLPDVPEGQAAAKEGDEAAAKPASQADGDAAAALARSEEEEAKAQAALESRRQVERENRLAQEAYDAKVKAVRERVQELNNRFADWFYVIPEEAYAKIRLGRADVIRAKPPADTPPAAPAAEPAP